MLSKADIGVLAAVGSLGSKRPFFVSQHYCSISRQPIFSIDLQERWYVDHSWLATGISRE